MKPTLGSAWCICENMPRASHCMVVNRSTSASSTSVCETCLQTTAANMHLIHLNESNFDQTISQSPLPILVHFSASWCGPCRMIAPVLDEIAKEQDDVV